jgi:hypothetical protein
MTDKKLEEQTREQIMEFLPSAIKRACESYHGFMEADFVTAKSKLFTDHQNAGKAAAAHIHLLFKLTQWAGLQEKMLQNKDFTACMDVAFKEANSYEPPEEDLA